MCAIGFGTIISTFIPMTGSLPLRMSVDYSWKCGLIDRQPKVKTSYNAPSLDILQEIFVPCIFSAQNFPFPELGTLARSQRAWSKVRNKCQAK